MIANDTTIQCLLYAYIIKAIEADALGFIAHDIDWVDLLIIDSETIGG